MTTTTAPADAQPQPFTLSAAEWRTFIGLILGMFVAAISQSIVGTAMPRIVAELGGMEHYSWVATAAMLASAIVTPIIGKLSDLYGRKSFYMGGLTIFMLGSVISGLSVSFPMLVIGRAVQGMGMGTLIPLSQTVIGDLVPPRHRGKFQGYMGAVFGVTTVAGPLVGGFITDHWGWRWLFFVTLPIGLVALWILFRFMHLPFTRRDATIDIAGMATLSGALVCILLAASLGGTSYPWDSPLILGLFAAGAVLTVLFVLIERRAVEPVLPLRLFRNAVFTLCLISGLVLSTIFFGAIIYLPVFAQGVLGVGATTSGMIIMPLSVGQIVMGIAAGWIISKTGRYKELMLLGVVVLGAGVYLLTQLTATSAPLEVTVAMVVLGVGIGAVMQQYTLLVQNVVARSDLGVATASTQFFRNVGSTLGIAVWGTVMTSGLGASIAKYLPAGTPSGAGAGLNAGSVLDPAVLAQLPAPVADAIRHGLADQLHAVFQLWLPIVGVLFLSTLFIKELPLRETVHTNDEARREYLDTVGASSVSTGVTVEPLSEGRATRTQERLLGLQFELLQRQAQLPDRPMLRRAVTNLGDGDFERGLARRDGSADLLSTDDDRTADRAEAAAVALGRKAGKHAILDQEMRHEIALAAASASEPAKVLAKEYPLASKRYEAVDLGKMSRVCSQLASAFLVDMAAPRRAAD